MNPSVKSLTGTSVGSCRREDRIRCRRICEISLNLEKNLSKKAQIARRLVEVLEYFDDVSHKATVMDVARHYDRPQSSTSELMATLVDLGLLYKNPSSREYRLAPRAALIGATAQTGVFRDGRILRLMDALLVRTGLTVSVYSMLGSNIQLVKRRSAAGVPVEWTELAGGAQEPLHLSAAGWLMLSVIDPKRCDGLLRRLNAEAPEKSKFNHVEMRRRIDACRNISLISGPAAFKARARSLNRLLHDHHSASPLVISLICASDAPIDTSHAGDILNRMINDIGRNCNFRQLPR